MTEDTADPVAGRRADFLTGLRVLELGDGVAGASATSILWSLGAEVTTVVDPTSPHRRGRPSVPLDEVEVSLLSVCLDRGKSIESAVDPSRLEALLRSEVAFDVVVFDRVLGAQRGLSSLAAVSDYVDFVAAHDDVAWVTISAFGLSGPRANDRATELTVAAAGGMLSAVRDEATGLPLKLAGQQSLLNAGQAAALAACHALDLARSEGHAHLDLSAVEATLATGPVLEVGSLLLNTGSLGGAKRYGAPASFYECRDGHIRISAMEDHQWNGVVAAMGSPEWADRFATVAERIEHADEVDDLVGEWAALLTKLEAETLLQSHGVPATAVYAPSEILESPQVVHRDLLESLPVGDGRRARIAGKPFRVVAGNHAGSRRRRRTLRGFRLLEASRVLAVPLAGAILATLGAEVTKLEDLRRLDMYRRRGPYIDGKPGQEWSAYFALMNHSKRSVAFDVDGDRARLDELLDDTDAVIENLGPKRAGSLGLAAATAPEARPDVLAVSSTGFGQDGPHARYRAYAYNLQASCALGYLTRNQQGESAEIDIAWADLIAAYALATIIAAWAVGPEGNAGAGVDFAMADLIVAHFNEFLAAASLGLEEDVDRGNDLAPFAPNGVYPASDGWIAISVEDDDQFARLSEVLEGSGLDDEGLAHSRTRLERRADIDEAIAACTRDLAAAEMVATLQAVGVMAEPVLDAAGLLADAQIAERGFLVPVDHDEWGPRRLVGVPWRPYGKPALPLGPPPRLMDERDE